MEMAALDNLTGCPLGVNAHLAYVDIGKLIERMQWLRPRTLVGFIDSDNDMPKVRTLKAALPDTLVIGRAYLKDGVEGKFHLQPEAPGDIREYIAAPADVVNRWGDLGKIGMSLNVHNEPGTDDPDRVTRLVKWTCDALDYAVTQAVHLTVLNLATGHPRLSGKQWDYLFDPLLLTLSKYRDWHTLGLHEYLPEDGRIGRFKAMIERCKVLGIQPPRVVMTEFGVDSGPGEKVNGYKSRGWDGADYAMKLIDLVERVYRPYLDDGTLLGLNVFSYGNSGIWNNYDVSTDQGYWDTLKDWHYQPTAVKPVEVIPVDILVDKKAPEILQPAAPVAPATTPAAPSSYATIAGLLRQLADAFEALD